MDSSLLMNQCNNALAFNIGRQVSSEGFSDIKTNDIIIQLINLYDETLLIDDLIEQILKEQGYSDNYEYEIKLKMKKLTMTDFFKIAIFLPQVTMGMNYIQSG